MPDIESDVAELFKAEAALRAAAQGRKRARESTAADGVDEECEVETDGEDEESEVETDVAYEECEVECIVAEKHTNHTPPRWSYQVKWVDYEVEDDEPYWIGRGELLQSAPKVVADWEKKQRRGKPKATKASKRKAAKTQYS